MSQDKPQVPPTLAIAGPCESLLTGSARDQLEKSVIPQFMANQRWFGAKARRIDGMRIVDWVRVDVALATFVTFVEVQFAGGNADQYCVPLSLATGDAAQTLLRDSAASVLATFTSADGEGVIYDALVNDAGVFVGKAFQGGAAGTLIQRLRKSFTHVKHVKPPASRAQSVELYLVATGFRGG